MSVGQWVGVWTGVWVGACVARILKMPGRNNRIGAQIHIALYYDRKNKLDGVGPIDNRPSAN